MHYVDIDLGELDEAEPFRFLIDGKKFELPALGRDSTPLELLPAVLLVTSEDVTDSMQGKAAAAVLEYIRADHPKLWDALRKSAHPTPLMNGLIRQWTEYSKLDPKA